VQAQILRLVLVALELQTVIRVRLLHTLVVAVVVRIFQLLLLLVVLVVVVLVVWVTILKSTQLLELKTLVAVEVVVGFRVRVLQVALVS
jgi:hypothetical protein